MSIIKTELKELKTQIKDKDQQLKKLKEAKINNNRKNAKLRKDLESYQD